MTTTIKPDIRYSVLPYLTRRMDRVGRSMGFSAKSRAEHAKWRKALVARLKEITGYDTMVAGPLKPRVTERKKCSGYTRERVEVETEPGIVAVFYVLVPAGPAPRAGFPVVLCPHGHASGGKLSTAGRSDIPEIARQIEVFNYDYGVQFCKSGFVTICPDARGFGERVEPSVYKNLGRELLTQSCMYINHMAFPLGQTITGMWAWELHRIIDYVQTRKDCDADRIGCAGLSGGGLQTIWAAALDERNRIKAAVVSGYFYGYQEALLIGHQNCPCNYVPHLHETADLGALIAPRPLMIETGMKDPLNGQSGMKNVYSQVKITRAAYKLFGAEKNLVHDVFDGGHKWHGTLAVPWMTKLLGRSPNPKDN